MSQNTGGSFFPQILQLGYPRIPANVVAFEAEVSNNTSSFHVSGIRDDSIVQGTIDERGENDVLSSARIQVSSLSSGEVNITSHPTSKMEVAAISDEFDEDEQNEDEKEEYREEYREEEDKAEEDMKEEEEEKDEEPTDTAASPSGVSIITGNGYRLLIQGQIELEELKTEEGVTFLVRASASDFISYGVGGGDVIFKFTFKNTDTTAQLKIGPGQATQSITNVSMERADETHIRIIIN